MVINILLSLHKKFYSLNDLNSYKGKNLFLWVLTNCGYRIFAKLLNLWVYIRHLFCTYSKPSTNKNENIVVSLTSFPARINKVWMTIDSLMRQTVAPSSINLYLSEEDFPQKEKSLGTNLLRFKKYGLNIVWVKDNLRPHKKYLYAFQQYPGKCIVTVDDDLYYREDMLSRLIALHESYPNAVCANNTKVIPSHKFGKIPLYKNWLRNNQPAFGHNLIGIGFGGILYPVTLFNNVDFANIELIKDLSLGTDDLWLKAMELIADIPVTTGIYNCTYPKILGSQKSSLSKENWKEEDRNDTNWRKLYDHFQLLKYLN